MTDFSAVALTPRKPSWPVEAVDELADALFGPKKDWQKADRMIEREMERPTIDTRTQFLIALSARHLPAIVNLHRSDLRRGRSDPLFPPGRFLYLPFVVLSVMTTEYCAKYIRDSPASIGHGFMLDELYSIERSLRGELGFLRQEASQHPLPDRAREALSVLFERAHILLFIWTHIPSQARTSLFVDRGRYSTLESVLGAFMKSDKRTEQELKALQEELSSQWTRGRLEPLFLLYLVQGDFTSSTELFDIIKCQASWLSCEADRDETCASCQELPEGEEMKACGRCGTVRYCSKDHQRAHWKKHKLRCFPVAWDVQPAPPPVIGSLDDLD